MGGRLIARCTLHVARYTLHVARYTSTVRAPSPWNVQCGTCNASSYSRARTPPVHDADLAPRPARDAHAPTVQDQRVREPGPLVPWHERHEVPLDLHGIP